MAYIITWGPLFFLSAYRHLYLSILSFDLLSFFSELVFFAYRKERVN